MKIGQSEINLSSDNQFEQMDLSVSQKRSGKFRRFRRQQIRNPQSLDAILVDRISIQQHRTTRNQSNYSFQSGSRSIVTDLNHDTTVEFEQSHAMEKLVGGLIDKDAVISKLEQVSPQSDTDQEISTPEKRPRRRSIDSRQWSMAIKQTDIHFEEQTMAFASNGTVTTEDGRTIDFALDMSLSRSFFSETEQETLVNRWQETINLTDPLVISLDGKAPSLSNAKYEFDLNSDGTGEHINFVNAGSGFLAFDKNKDGVINNGSELFGPGTGNGFGELSALDLDQNDWIDENDAVFSQLSVWTKDEDGQDRLISLKDAGLGAISLKSVSTAFNMTEEDNSLQGQMRQSGIFLFENGNIGSMHQIDLVSHEIEKETPDIVSVSNSAEDLPESDRLPENPISLSPRSEVPEAGADDVNPLKELLDRIEELKAEMTKLYEAMDSAPERRRGRRSRRRRQLFIGPDPAVLESGFNIRRARIANRYV